MLGIGIGVSPMINRSSVSYNAITTAWIAQVIANGGSVTGAEATAISTYTDAIQIGEFDRLWVHGLQNEIAAKTSIVNPTSTMITNVNSTTFTAGEGFTGNGSTMYLNGNFNPSTQGVKYTLNSALCFVYSTLDIDENSRVFGANDGVNFIQSILRLSNQKYTAINSGAVFAIDTNANSLGTHADIREDASNVSFYKNGTLVTTTAQASLGLPNTNIFLLARSDSGVANFFSTNRLAITGFGSKLANTGLASANNTLATTLGFNV